MRVRGVASFAVCVFALFVATLALCAGLLLCPKCGYEYEAGETVCGHCGAALPTPEKEAPAPEKPVVEKVAIDAALVNKELDRASAQLDKGNFWLAVFFCENAMGLNLLSDSSVDRSKRILELSRKAETGLQFGQSPCPACGGSGKIARSTSVVSLEDEVTSRALPPTICHICGGGGRVAGRTSLRQLRYSYGAAMKEYSVMRQGARWTPLGNSWLPPGAQEGLTVKQTAAMKRATSGRCQTCLGIGRVACETCGGAGKVKCPNKQCANGFVREKLEGSLTGTQRYIRSRCKVCGGNMIVSCQDCNGGGSVMCKDCGGSGLLPVCRTCDGAGTVVCSKCKGTGKIKSEPCPDCDGAGEVLCKTCAGNGKAR